jgi:aminoglycoside phosphotransferase (APT) family kinase protein
VHTGVPEHGCLFPWAVYRWLPRETFDDDRVEDGGATANALVEFVLALRGVDPRDAPPSRRGRPLAVRDGGARASIESSRVVVDADAVTAAWEASLGAPEWDGDGVWTHSDLLRPNVLVRNGRLSAVLDSEIWESATPRSTSSRHGRCSTKSADDHPGQHSRWTTPPGNGHVDSRFIRH